MPQGMVIVQPGREGCRDLYCFSRRALDSATLRRTPAKENTDLLLLRATWNRKQKSEQAGKANSPKKCHLFCKNSVHLRCFLRVRTRTAQYSIRRWKTRENSTTGQCVHPFRLTLFVSMASGSYS